MNFDELKAALVTFATCERGTAEDIAIAEIERLIDAMPRDERAAAMQYVAATVDALYDASKEAKRS